MVRAFGDDGMRLLDGGGRGVACARRHLGGKLIGTLIRHSPRCEPPSRPIRSHRIAVIELTLRARLMSRVGRPSGQTVADLTTARAVDLAVIVDLAEVKDPPAPRATNLRKSHARTSATVLAELAPPVRPRAPSHGQRPRATRRPGLVTWAFIYFAVEQIAYATS
jgi:hypothetical protein